MPFCRVCVAALSRLTELQYTEDLYLARAASTAQFAKQRAQQRLPHCRQVQRILGW